ncbi:hypothetical protein G6R29_04275 [Fructobacillus sp. M2-14]|uniref:Uncharacterized protein n=1 Tax=Fructobacillus broussonetiae TaxID=2713173 RepID=A0ABS5R1M4_9LACO|nr:hypothetical protein [Fructobacillus broussonetiae]MBS9338840.1 hypothetical protein [Fructobacillus broussonetiae]
MLLITKIKTKELKSYGPAESWDWDDLAIPETGFGSKKDVVQAVIEAYDLGELSSYSHVSSPGVLKASVEKDGKAYHLSAHLKEE